MSSPENPFDPNRLGHRIRRIHIEPPSDADVPPLARDKVTRRIIFTSPDGSPSDTDKVPDRVASSGAEGEPQDDTVAFLELLRVAPDDVKAWMREKGLNVGDAHDLYTGRTKASDYRDGAQPTFTHAGTGEQMRQQDVVDQIEQPLSPDLQRATGAAIDTLTGESDAPSDKKEDV